MKSTPDPIAAAGPRFLGLRRRSLLAVLVSLAAAVMVAIAFLLAAGRPAFASSGSEISGKVVDATSGKVVGGLEVTLHAVRDGSETGTDTTTTGSDGRFSFPDAGGEAGTSYVLSARYRGAEYQTEAIEVALGERAGVTLQVYEPTSSPEGITQTQWTVWVDQEGEGFAVQQDVEARNDGDRSYVGSEKVEGGHVVWDLPLTAGASNFQYLGSFIRCCGAVRAGSFVHTAPIPPGTSIATLRYSTGSLEQLSFPAVFPTDAFTLLVPASLDVRASGLTEAGKTTDRGITYQIFDASGLAAGDSVEVTLTQKSGGGATKSTLTTAVGLLAVLMGIAIAVFVRRARPAPRRGNARGAPAKAGSRRRAARQPRPVRRGPVTARKARSAPAARRTQRLERVPVGELDEEVLEAEEEEAFESGLEDRGELEDVEDEEDLLLEEIAALDLAFERGLLDERRHQRLRAAAKARLLGLRSDTVAGRRS